MAKQRSGLGRGLGSLLGGDLESTLNQESSSPEVNTEPDMPKPVQPPAVPPKPAAEQKVNVVESDIYTNKEDNVTIKGVVEREVRTPVVAPTSSEAKKPDDKDVENQTEVDIVLIEPNPNQPRTNFNKEKLEELAESIRKDGLLQPILVRRIDNRFQIIAGERRWQACKLVGLKKVPVVIREVDEDESVILALIENLQRSDLNPIEEAYAYRRMMERGKMTQSEVAQAVSKGRTTITNALRLLDLPEDAQELLFEEKITAGHARAILSIPSKEGRRKLTDKLVEEKLSVRDAERIAKQLSNKKENKEKQPKQQAPKSYKTVARALGDTLKAEVKIKSVNGKNKIEISFKDEADLQRLYRTISNAN